MRSSRRLGRAQRTAFDEPSTYHSCPWKLCWQSTCNPKSVLEPEDASNHSKPLNSINCIKLHKISISPPSMSISGWLHPLVQAGFPSHGRPASRCTCFFGGTVKATSFKPKAIAISHLNQLFSSCESAKMQSQTCFCLDKLSIYIVNSHI